MDQDDAAMDRLCQAVDQYLTDKILIGSSVYVEPRTSCGSGSTSGSSSTCDGDVQPHPACGEQVDSVIRQILSFDVVDFGTQVTMGSIYGPCSRWLVWSGPTCAGSP